MMPIAMSLHVLSATIWVGGMFFAYMALRPAAAAVLDPPPRLTLWLRTFARFFPWVWAVVILLPVTGLWMVAQMGGFGGVGAAIRIMAILAVAMIAIFLHIFFAPYRRLRRCVEAADWPAGGKELAQIRRWVGINLVLGLITVAVASGGLAWH